MISSYDKGSGAERVASDLFDKYSEKGFDTRMFVKYIRTERKGIYQVNRFQSNSGLQKLIKKVSDLINNNCSFRGMYRIIDWLANINSHNRIINKLLGVDNYYNPNETQFLNLEDGWTPDIIHAHNLHGDYFDLNSLSLMCSRVPVIITAHDTWLLTGHCAYFMDCMKWKDGCGNCPDLNRYLRIYKDRTNFNLQTKIKILKNNENLIIVTPSRWLYNQFKLIMDPARLYHIPLGVDERIFFPLQDEKNNIRKKLGLPQNKKIIISAFSSNKNAYKDAKTVKNVYEKIIASRDDCVFIMLGSNVEKIKSPCLLTPGFISDRNLLADYFRASDIFIHATNADNFPCSIIEAQLCGLPVLASSVGGIPEQIINGKTGYCIRRGSVRDFIIRLEELLSNENLLNEMSRNAIKNARTKFRLENEVEEYKNLFMELLGEDGKEPIL